MKHYVLKAQKIKHPCIKRPKIKAPKFINRNYHD